MVAGTFSSLRRMMGEDERDAIARLVRSRMTPICKNSAGIPSLLIAIGPENFAALCFRPWV